MDKQFYIYLAIMSLITYAIRAIPLVFINKKLRTQPFNPFLDYIPYTVLAAMTFPDTFLFNRSFDFWNRCDNHYYLCIL
mgnify:CR=1 FL=1